MKHSEVMQAYRALGVLLRAGARREDWSPRDVQELVSQALGEETLAQKRARAGRAGGKRSVDARRAKDGTAQPRSNPEAGTEPIPEAPPEADSKQGAIASEPDAAPVAPPRHSPSGSGFEKSKESAVVAKDLIPSARVANAPGATTPTDFESAMRETVAKRCALARADASLAVACELNRWPEVIAITTAWHEAKELPGAPRLKPPGEDVDVLALLDVLALGYEPEQVEQLVRYLAKHAKFRHLVLLRAVLKHETLQIAIGETWKQRPRRQTSAPRPIARQPSRDELRANAEAAERSMRSLVATVGAGRTAVRAGPDPAHEEEPPRAAGAAE